MVVTKNKKKVKPEQKVKVALNRSVKTSSVKSSSVKSSGEFKNISKKKIKAFKKPDLIVKKPSLAKKIIPVGIASFAAGALAGAFTSSQLNKKMVKVSQNVNEPNISEIYTKFNELQAIDTNMKLDKEKALNSELKDNIFNLTDNVKKLNEMITSQKNEISSLQNLNNNLDKKNKLLTDENIIITSDLRACRSLIQSQRQ